VIRVCFRFLFVLAVCASGLEASSYSLSLAKTNAIAGERVGLKIRVLSAGGTTDTNYCGYVRIGSDGLRFRGKAGYAPSGDSDVDGTGSIEVFLNRGTNASLHVCSFTPGTFVMRVEDPYERISAKRISLFLSKPMGKILFSEVMFKTASSSLRFVELYNPTPGPVTLTNVSIARYSSSSSSVLSAPFYSSAGSVLLPAREYALIPADISVLSGFFPDAADPAIVNPGPLSSSLSTSGSQLILFRNGLIEDACEYESAWTTDNVSLERISWLSPASDESAWRSSRTPSPVDSGVLATPGRENSSSGQEGSSVRLSIDPDETTAHPDDLPLRVLSTADRDGLLSLCVLDSEGRTGSWLLRNHPCTAGIPVEAFLPKDDSMAAGLHFFRLEYTDEQAGLRVLSHKSFVLGW
jgi:hypothetical protein